MLEALSAGQERYEWRRGVEVGFDVFTGRREQWTMHFNRSPDLREKENQLHQWIGEKRVRGEIRSPKKIGPEKTRVREKGAKR